MKRISINSYAKINLSLDVLGVNEGGYHEVSMIMQQVKLHDDVLVRFISKNERRDTGGWHKQSGSTYGDGRIAIELSTNRPYLSKDERNIAFKAAILMAEAFGNREDLRDGKIRIDIKKRIPVAAGLAGGSGNAAAVLHALNVLWQLRLSCSELQKLGEKLGSDVPFCVMGQAEEAESKESVSYAALAEGTGTMLTPVPALNASIILVKPSFSVSTREVYGGVDAEIEKCRQAGTLIRPNNEELIEGLGTGDKDKILGNMVNLLELYTLKKHSRIEEIKKKLRETGADAVLMSGSGPTVYAVYFDRKKAENAYRKVRFLCRETFITRTLC